MDPRIRRRFREERKSSEMNSSQVADLDSSIPGEQLRGDCILIPAGDANPIEEKGVSGSGPPLKKHTDEDDNPADEPEKHN